MNGRTFTLEGVADEQPDGSMRVVGVLRPIALPGVPANLRVVEFSNSFVSLAWDPVNGAITYDVFRDGIEIATVSSPARVDNTVAASTTYDYQVRATNVSGDSALCTAIQVTTAAQAAPSPPTNVRLVVNNPVSARHAEFEWDNPGNVSEWEVYRDAVLQATIAINGYTDNTLAPSTLYQFTVKAKNAAGTSAASSALSVTTNANGPPLWDFDENQVGVTGQLFQLDLRTVCVDPDGHAITFSVFSGSVPGLALAGSNLSGAFTTAGAHTIVLRANDGFINSDLSATFTVADPDITAPSVPANVVSVVNGSTVTTTWNASTDASGILRYQVQRNGAFRGNTTELQWVENNLPAGDYTFSIKARDASANENVSAEGTGNLVTVAPPPAAPDAPIYAQPNVVSTTQINHSWSAGPAGATPTSYELDRGPSASGPWTNVFAGLATSFNDTGLTPSTLYHYRLRAAAGAIFGPYSTRSATTQSVGSSGYEFPSGTTPVTSSAPLITVATYNNISIYWDEALGSASNEAFVRFRKVGESAWRQGLSLWWDERNTGTGAQQVPATFSDQYRGSILKVDAGSQYEIEVLAHNSGTNRRIRTTTVTTWTEVEDLPIASITALPASSSQQLTISANGSANGWHVYQPTANWQTGDARHVIDVNRNADYCVLITGSYVILRGMTLRDARDYGIGLAPSCHHVVLDDCVISNYGHNSTVAGYTQYACNNTGAIGTTQSGVTVNLGILAVTIQDCLIDPPEFDCNSWEETPRTEGGPCGPGSDPFHPAGSKAIYLNNTGGQFVIRYNTARGDPTHMLADVFGGQTNFGHRDLGQGRGAMPCDSDIHNNDLSYTWDDGLASEGENANNRIYENLIRRAKVGVAAAATFIGPLYVIRNMFTRGLAGPASINGGDGNFFKIHTKPNGATTPSQITIGQGRVYLFHSTIAKEVAGSNGTGVKGCFNTDGLGMFNIVSRNNIYDTNNNPNSSYIDNIKADCDFDYDLVRQGSATPWLNTPGTEDNGIEGTPLFEALGGSVGMFTLQAGSPGANAGVYLPNVNDDHFGAAPDMGAQERGASIIHHGRRTS